MSVMKLGSSAETALKSDSTENTPGKVSSEKKLFIECHVNVYRILPYYIIY